MGAYRAQAPFSERADIGVVRATFFRGHAWLWVAGPVGVVAFAARLVPVLRGGGLFGLGNYDDGVYFAAAVGLAHGLLPYRDFLLLHPPGIVLLLWPFAQLGRLTGDATALAVARVGFMALGALDAVLVSALLRRLGAAAALLGGLCLAVFYPAVFIGHSTILETPQITCVLVALLLLTSRSQDSPGSATPALLAGVTLGAAAGIKIWGIVIVAALVGWAAVALDRRRFLAVLAGLGAGVTAICLPFYLEAPSSMWRMVVSDQLGRNGSDVTLPGRVSAIFGVTGIQPGVHGWPTLTFVALAVLAGCAVPAARTQVGRLGLLLLGAGLAVLLSAPSWYPHYAGLTAAPLAMVFGAGAGQAVDLTRGRFVRTAVSAALVLGLAAYAMPGLRVPFGSPFPAAALRASVASRSGCVTADDPTALMELGALTSNLDRGCPFVIDLTGYGYDLRARGSHALPRGLNDAWQQRVLTYLRSGRTALVLQLGRDGLQRDTKAVIQSWPALARVGGLVVRQPEPCPAALPRGEHARRTMPVCHSGTVPG